MPVGVLSLRQCCRSTLPAWHHPLPWAATPDNNASSLPPPVLTPKTVHVSRGHAHSALYQGVQIPAWPSDGDITYSRAFQEPLVPVGGKTTSDEDHALGAAIRDYVKRTDVEDVSALTGFTDQFPNSAWRPALDLNLAQVMYHTGNFSKALETWGDAWARTQNLTDATGQKIANLAVGQLAEMKARIGRTDELDALYKQIKGRNVSGTSRTTFGPGRAGLWLMKSRPQDAFRCGALRPCRSLASLQSTKLAIQS